MAEDESFDYKKEGIRKHYIELDHTNTYHTAFFSSPYNREIIFSKYLLFEL